MLNLLGKLGNVIPGTYITNETLTNGIEHKSSYTIANFEFSGSGGPEEKIYASMSAFLTTFSSINHARCFFIL